MLDTVNGAPVGAQINAKSGTRLFVGLVFAVIVHLSLILGLTFVALLTKSEPAVADLEVTLVTHFSDQSPVDADFWAQENQQASGTEEDVRKLTTNEIEAANGENEAEGEDLSQARVSALVSGAQLLTTESDAQAAEVQETKENEISEQQRAFEAELLARRQAIRAALDVKQQEYAKRPKIGTLTSVSAKARHDAAYQLHLQNKIISNGNANYPVAALKQGLFGDLRLKMILLRDGSLESTEILESSGHVLLDQAALEIARKSAPFDAFPPETASRYDKIVFIRTWQFLPGGFLRTDE